MKKQRSDNRTLSSKRRSSRQGAAIMLWDYIDFASRKRIASRIREKPQGSRTPMEQYQMVSTELVDAMLNEDETCFQNGISELLSLSRMDDVPALALLELGYFLLLRGLAAMAIPFLEQAATLSPRNRNIWSLKCLGHIRLGQRQQAIDSIAVAVDIESFPEDINLLEALQAGQESTESQAASVLFHPSLSLSDSSSETNFHNRIYRFVLHQIERIDSNNVEVTLELAKCYYRLNELERAEGYAKRALASKSCCSECLTLLGLIETNRKRDKDAIEYYRIAVECDDQALLAHINLASAIQSDGGWSESRSLLEKALQLVRDKEEKGALNESEREWACIGLDLLASNVGVSEHDVVRELALREQALEVGCSKTPAFVANFAMCLFFNAKFERFSRYLQQHRVTISKAPDSELLKFFSDFARKGSKDPVALLTIVDALVQNRNIEWSSLSRLLWRAFELSGKIPSDERAAFVTGIGVRAENADDGELALAAMERALKLDPHEPSYWANLAACYSFRGDHEKAINTAKRMPMEEGQRSYTMKGNVFRAAGLEEAAIEQYLLALEHDVRFELPIANGLDISASCGRWDLVEKFDAAIDSLKTPSINLMIAKAERRADRGYIEDAVEIYQAQLAPEGSFVVGIDQSDDITLIPGNPAKILSDWYWNFGKHLLVSSRWHDLADLFEFLKSPIGRFLRTGDHMVLEAEFLRLRGKWDEARAVLDQVNAQIPREISRILLALDEDDIVSAANRLLEIPSECPGQDSEDFKFWLGNCGPVLRSLNALVALQQGNAVLADKESAEALAYADSASFSDWVRVQVMEQTAPLSESMAVALSLLQRHPGNPQLIEWVVNRHLEAEDIDRAAETLQQFRRVLEGSGRRDTAAFLGEQVALRRAGANGSITLREWPWIDQFTEPTRGWLTAAGSQAADVGWLRLSITLLLAKVFEREFYLRIAQPFANACKFDNQDIEPDIREFVYALERGRTPSLGMIQHALWAAQLRPEQGNSSLMVSWRKHLAEIPWSGAVKLRDKAWLRWLSKLTQVRNRAAHAGDITQSEFEMVLAGFVIDDTPGPALTVLGVGLEDKSS